MTAYYEQFSRFFVAVDCIGFGVKDGRLSLLLTRRAFEPEMGRWSLMGGFVGPDESVDQAAARVLAELTGLAHVHMHQVGAFGAIDRDPGERVVSVAYYALLNASDVDPELLESHGARWVDLEKLPPLAFDHPQMISRALHSLRRNIVERPLAFSLLPELFTLTQLQGLYELVLGELVDKRITRNACLEPTELIDKTGSKRGARLYRYNSRKYDEEPLFRL